MTKWISVSERMPEVGTPIWALFCKKNGEPRKRQPVTEGDFGRSPFDHDFIGFILGIHRNTAVSVEYCREAGLTHWQPRRDDTPPSPALRASPVGSQPERERIKRHYNMTPEGTAAKREKMREYWRKRKVQVDSVQDEPPK